jgi:hypothetical protein
MKLTEIKKRVDSAATFFDGKIKTIIEDSQRSYRMKLKDQKDRESRGLSAIPSTKSTAAVDRFVERSIIEYHQDPDAISFSSKSVGDPSKDRWAKLLSEVFRYRSKSTNNGFNFYLWNQSSLTACAVDGIEANLYRWERTSYKEKVKKYFTVNPDQTTQEVPKEIYDQGSLIFPELFKKETVEVETVCTDTFVIDQLQIGKDIVWDPKTPLMDIQRAGFVAVFLDKSPQDILNLAAAGIIDKISLEDIKKHQKDSKTGITLNMGASDSRSTDDPDDMDLGDDNRVKLWLFFYNENNRKMVHFSLGGKTDLGKARNIDELWFNGRKVNRYPVTVGTIKLKLWEAVGRGIPETIAPIEKEHIDHKNNFNDAAKIAIQGRYRLDPDADINVDDLLNSRAFYADSNSFERIKDDFGVLNTLRANDNTVADIMELIPAGMMTGARGLVAKGTEQTLGAKQLGKMESDEKLGVSIMTRNETTLKNGLYLIAQLLMAYETDETVLRIAGKIAGVPLPEVTTPEGKSILDLSVLDFDVDVEINAGLGSSNRGQKASNTMQLVDWGKGHGVNVDVDAAFVQLSILAGYSGDQLIIKAPQAAPQNKMDFKVSVAAKLELMPPEVQQMIFQGISKAESIPLEMDGGANQAAMNLAKQNGDGMTIPDRTGQIVDGTGNAAMGMSEGGQQNG